MLNIWCLDHVPCFDCITTSKQRILIPRGLNHSKYGHQGSPNRNAVQQCDRKSALLTPCHSAKLRPHHGPSPRKEKACRRSPWSQSFAEMQDMCQRGRGQSRIFWRGWRGRGRSGRLTTRILARLSYQEKKISWIGGKSIRYPGPIRAPDEINRDLAQKPTSTPNPTPASFFQSLNNPHLPLPPSLLHTAVALAPEQVHHSVECRREAKGKSRGGSRSSRREGGPRGGGGVEAVEVVEENWARTRGRQGQLHA